jgi:hypothetical protein
MLSALPYGLGGGDLRVEEFGVVVGVTGDEPTHPALPEGMVGLGELQDELRIHRRQR